MSAAQETSIAGYFFSKYNLFGTNSTMALTVVGPTNISANALSVGSASAGSVAATNFAGGFANLAGGSLNLTQSLTLSLGSTVQGYNSSGVNTWSLGDTWKPSLVFNSNIGYVQAPNGSVSMVINPNSGSFIVASSVSPFPQYLNIGGAGSNVTILGPLSSDLGALNSDGLGNLTAASYLLKSGAVTEWAVQKATVQGLAESIYESAPRGNWALGASNSVLFAFGSPGFFEVQDSLNWHDWLKVSTNGVEIPYGHLSGDIGGGTNLPIAGLRTNGFAPSQVLGMAADGSGFAALTQNGGTAQTNMTVVTADGSVSISSATTNNGVITFNVHSSAGGGDVLSSGNNVFTGSNYDTGSHTFHLPILGSSDGQTNAAGSKVAGLNDVTAATNNTVKAAGSVILGGTNINIGNPTFHGPLVLGDGADLTPISSGSSIPVFGLEPSTYKVRVFQGIGVNEPSGDLFIPGILSANYGGSIKGLILGTNADGTTMQQAATNAAAAATNNFPASSIASGGTLPALNGSALTSLTGGNVSGTVSAATTATTANAVALAVTNQWKTDATNAAEAVTNNFPASSIASGGTLPALNGSALTSLTGGNVSGTVSAATTATTANAVALAVTNQWKTDATNAAAAVTNNFPASSIASGGTLPALNGSALTSLTGGNVSGTVSAATTAATITGLVTNNIYSPTNIQSLSSSSTNMLLDMSLTRSLFKTSGSFCITNLTSVSNNLFAACQLCTSNASPTSITQYFGAAVHCSFINTTNAYNVIAAGKIGITWLEDLWPVPHQCRLRRHHLHPMKIRTFSFQLSSFSFQVSAFRSQLSALLLLLPAFSQAQPVMGPAQTWQGGTLGGSSGGGGGTTYTVGHTNYLTSTGAHTWTVDAAWNSSSNWIYCIGGGGSGYSSGSGGGGGGGGAFAGITNLTLTPSGSANYSVGIGGSANGAGGDSWFNATTLAGSSVGAKGGSPGTASGGGNGGVAASGVNSQYSGGAGGSTTAGQYTGGGGGGAAGPFGVGAKGGAGWSTPDPGGGGGGNGGGSAGADATGSVGGNGGNNHSGSGHGTGASGATGSNPGFGWRWRRGGDDNSDTNAVGGTGGGGTEWDSTHGSGGGGGGSGASGTNTVAPGGNYGGGGGGSDFTQPGGLGAQGIIVIIYWTAS